MRLNKEQRLALVTRIDGESVDEIVKNALTKYRK